MTSLISPYIAIEPRNSYDTTDTMELNGTVKKKRKVAAKVKKSKEEEKTRVK